MARHVLDVARAGIPGWRVVFLTPPGDLPRQLEAAGAAVIERPFGPEHGLRALRGVTPRLVTRHLRPAVVHSHLSYADIIAALAVTGPKLVTTEHGIARDDVVYHHSGSKARVMAAAHTSPLPSLRCRHRRQPRDGRGDAGQVAPAHPRDRHPQRDRRRRGSRERRDCGSCRSRGWLPRSDCPSSWTGSRSSGGRHPEATLTLAGTGPEEHALRAHVDRLGLAGAVTLPGFVDPDDAMDSHDVLAMMSVWENCSYALLDAAARGMGVVASDVGGNPEILPTRSLVVPDDTGRVATALVEQGPTRQLGPA